MSVFDRLLSKFEVNGDCWIWTAALTSNGYGLIDDDQGRTRRAHRLMYEHVVGPIPQGLELDHLCRERRCVNPAHLEPVTHAENMRRSAGFNLRDRCQQGHPFDGENTAIVNTKRGPERRCRTCKNQRLREWKARRRAA